MTWERRAGAGLLVPLTDERVGRAVVTTPRTGDDDLPCVGDVSNRGVQHRLGNTRLTAETGITEGRSRNEADDHCFIGVQNAPTLASARRKAANLWQVGRQIVAHGDGPRTP